VSEQVTEPPAPAPEYLPEEEQRARRILRPRNIIAALIVIAVIALAWYLIHNKSAGGRQGRGRPAPTVGVTVAKNSDMPVRVDAIGTVQPIVTATVRPQLSGVLFSLHFTEGQMVRKGQLLAQIDPRPYRLALSQAQANLARDAAQLELARTVLKRDQILLTQDSIARQDVDTQAASAKQLEGTVAADRAAIGTAKLNLAYTSITAPVSGRVGLRQADIGNYLTPGDATGVAVITQTTPIDVSFALPQAQLPIVAGKLANGGLAVQAHDQSGTTTLAEGSFLTFDNQIDATTGTVKAKARFPNPDGKLFPNQFVNVSILVDTLKGAVIVPVSAVRHGAQGDFVFLLQPDRTVKLQVVKTGPADDRNVVILTGVAAGAKVISEGADGLDDGSKVMLPGDKPQMGGGRGGRRHKGANADSGDNASAPADQGNGSGEHHHHRRDANGNGSTGGNGGGQ
jgi:membrane fusion protein, multidrug efflux system